MFFSHGTFSNKESYDLVLSHWASYGFVVIAMDHEDANYARVPNGIEDMENIVDGRAVDLSRVLDHLNDLEQTVPALAGAMDKTRIGAAGHSLGSMVAMLTGGLVERHPETGEMRAHDETRVQAVVMLSDPGKMALQPIEMWRGLTLPTFVVTSPDDIGLMGDGMTETLYEMEVMSGADAPKGSKYFMTIDGLDHYFGGLVQREKPDLKDDHEALELFKAASTAFLRATFWEDDEPARTYLEMLQDQGFSSPRARLETH